MMLFGVERMVTHRTFRKRSSIDIEDGGRNKTKKTFFPESSAGRGALLVSNSGSIAMCHFW
jgi:hypothetical protein